MGWNSYLKTDLGTAVTDLCLCLFTGRKIEKGKTIPPPPPPPPPPPRPLSLLNQAHNRASCVILLISLSSSSFKTQHRQISHRSRMPVRFSGHCRVHRLHSFHLPTHPPTHPGKYPIDPECQYASLATAGYIGSTLLVTFAVNGVLEYGTPLVLYRTINGSVALAFVVLAVYSSDKWVRVSLSVSLFLHPYTHPPTHPPYLNRPGFLLMPSTFLTSSVSSSCCGVWRSTTVSPSLILRCSRTRAGRSCFERRRRRRRRKKGGGKGAQFCY